MKGPNSRRYCLFACISLTSLSVGITLAACSKTPDASTETDPPPAGSSATTPSSADPGVSTPAVADTAAAEALALELTQVARKYAAEKQRAPKSLDEIVAAGYLPSTPVAPAGKKFAIDKNLQVYLADQ